MCLMYVALGRTPHWYIAQCHDVIRISCGIIMIFFIKGYDAERSKRKKVLAIVGRPIMLF